MLCFLYLFSIQQVLREVVMLDEPPPHPGPQPPPYQFPFDLAAAARDQADALVDALVRCRQDHLGARSDVEAGDFKGEAADRFRHRFDELIDVIDRQVAALQHQIEVLSRHERVARQRVDAREAERANWQRRYDAWATWRPAEVGS